MSSIKIVSVGVFALLLTACSIWEPFVDRRRNAGATDIRRLYVGKSTPKNPAICSNPLWTSKQTVQALADAECVKYNTGTHAVQTDVNHFSCKLLLPTHTFFKCEK